MGGPAFFSTLVGQAGEQELCQESCLHIFRQAPKNLLEKGTHRKLKILIKGVYQNFATSSMHIEVDRRLITADQFTYPLYPNTWAAGV